MSPTLLKNTCTYRALIRSQFVVIKRHSPSQHVSDVAAAEFSGQRSKQRGYLRTPKVEQVRFECFRNTTTYLTSAKDNCSQ